MSKRRGIKNKIFFFLNASCILRKRYYINAGILFQNIVSVKFHNIYSFLSKGIFAGVNCTKEDLEALTNTNNDVELLEFDENELWYEKSYK